MRIRTSLTKQCGQQQRATTAQFLLLSASTSTRRALFGCHKTFSLVSSSFTFFFFWCWARENSRSTVPAAGQPSGTNPPELNRLSTILVRFSFMWCCLVTLGMHLINSVKIYRFTAINISSFDSAALIGELKYKHVVVLLCYFPIQALALHLLWNK